MPLSAGARVGPYEIKLIPETFAADTSRLRRFEQEARAAGQLNHPNILAVTFDVTPDGKHIVFDRSRENSDVYLIDLPK